jgi:hypothetical protein
MLRRARFLLIKAPNTGGDQGDGKPAAKAKGKKKKWIDRRSTKVRHNGKEAYHFEEQPSCALCHVRFRYRQDYQTHKETKLHKDREAWVEMNDWFKDAGTAKFRENDAAEWAWYKRKVLAPKAERDGVDIEVLARMVRSAQVNLTPGHDTGVDVPSIKAEIREPRDQRWPASPKA